MKIHALKWLFWLCPAIAPLATEGGEGGGGGEGGSGGDAGGGGEGGEGHLLTGGSPAAGTKEPGAEGGAGAGEAGAGAPNAIVGEGGALNHDALFEAHPELEAHKATLLNYKTLDAALKGLGDTKSLVGRKLETVEATLNPGEDDVTGQSLKRQLLNIPDTPELAAYEFKETDGVEYDAERLSEFAKKAHELGISRTQFQALVDYQTELAAKDGGALDTAIQQADEQAKAKFWEDATKLLGGEDAKNEALDLTVRMLASTGLSNEEIGEIGKGLHHAGPNLVKALASLAKHTKEDALPASRGKTGTGVSAKQAYQSIMHDKGNPKHEAYRNPQHPDHESVRKEVQNLIKKASGKG